MADTKEYPVKTRLWVAIKRLLRAGLPVLAALIVSDKFDLPMYIVYFAPVLTALDKYLRDLEVY